MTFFNNIVEIIKHHHFQFSYTHLYGHRSVSEMPAFFTMFGFSGLNMVIMYLYFIYKGFFVRDMFPLFSALLFLSSILLDVSLLFILLLLVTMGRIRVSLHITFVVTLLWMFSNVLYSRFFFHFISLSALSQFGGIFDGIVIKSVIGGVGVGDMVFFLLPITYWWLNRYLCNIHFSKKLCLVILSLPLFCVVLSFVSYSSYYLLNPKYRNKSDLYLMGLDNYVLNPMSRKFFLPNNAFAYSGTIRFLINDYISDICPYVITDEKRNEIKKYYRQDNFRCTNYSATPPVKNVVFILLESFLSSTSELCVDGKEITPFLNSLKKEDKTFYNGKVAPNVTIGQSGDGQFIYMTGLLPLRSKVTVNIAKKITLKALPRILKDKFGVKYTEIVIPTSPIVWEQETMNDRYGIDTMYSAIEFGDIKTVNERTVFSIAKSSGIEKKQPFFQMILGISTHEPYDDIIDSSFVLSDARYSENYRHYLSACHYVDRQLNDYFHFLRTKNILDNTLVVIASDHNPPARAIDMVGKVTDDLPLYIVNGGIDKSKAFVGGANQLDVYTTILDVLNIDSEYRGLGYSLLSPYYRNSVNNKVWDLSESIILGDFWSVSE